ncbi:MAG: NADH-quinone oxidoreductase subunit A [Candidatus Altiarchaeales archaeon WOR_SM1_79]|nr:MAG: NADH-quinone oxidoreductase subunit A [Candidatus Altiarchaeales archaeon WOR_SM1_79]
MLIEEYIVVGVVCLVGIVIAVLVIELVNKLIMSRTVPTPLKYETYECGEISIGGTKINFGVQYYMYALVFVIFDVEVLFLFPWAVAFVKLGIIGFIEMMAFIGILTVGLIYAWKKGALEWVQN